MSEGDSAVKALSTGVDNEIKTVFPESAKLLRHLELGKANRFGVLSALPSFREDI